MNLNRTKLNLILAAYSILKEIEVKNKIQTFSHDFNHQSAKIAKTKTNLHIFSWLNQ